ncbi:amino acid ABC transporter substrate-binding protein [Campylobacterota bacterium]|nr:amino acid ABC transporter substrate-binding protein [Campylobacterota bacterium]
MKQIQKLLIFFLTAFVLAAFANATQEAATSTTPSIAEIKKRGVLRVGVTIDNPPFGFVDSGGKNQGYDVYFAKRIAKELLGSEEKIEFVPTTMGERAGLLESERVDVIFATYSITEDRKKLVDFASPYMKHAIGIVSSEENRITSPTQLVGKRLSVIYDSTADTFFTSEYPNITLARYKDVESIYTALLEGEVDAAAHDNTVLLSWVVRHNGYRMGVRSLGKVTPIAPAVKKGNTELCDYLNTLLFKLGREQFEHKAFYITLQPFYGSRIAPEEIVIEGGMY